MVLIDLPDVREGRHFLILDGEPPVKIAQTAAIAHILGSENWVNALGNAPA